MNTIPAKTIITSKNDDSWFSMNYNMNLYRGCCHGCIYCDSRSSCYHVEDFDTVRAKENAIEIVESELRRKIKTGVIATGAMSDPYNPFEQKYQLTRQALELIDTYHFGIAIATKSNLITRDIDLLSRIKKHSPVLCKITITSADDALSRIIEPGVCESSKRMEAIHQLSDAGIFTGILLMPLLPFITDTPENVREIVHSAHENGAKFIYPAFGVTMRDGQREWLYHELGNRFPDKPLAELYQKYYGNKYMCKSPRAKELWKEFVTECDRCHILYQMEDIVAAYRRNYDYQQLTFPF